MVVSILHKEPFEKESAFTLKETAWKLPMVNPAIVLLDYNLPDGTALMFCRNVNPYLKVVK